MHDNSIGGFFTWARVKLGCVHLCAAEPGALDSSGVLDTVVTFGIGILALRVSSIRWLNNA